MPQKICFFGIGHFKSTFRLVLELVFSCARLDHRLQMFAQRLKVYERELVHG